MTKYIILLLLINISVFSKAQVTIGCASEPIYGSILQLKENDSRGTNATKGFGFPRVFLSRADKLFPMFADGYNIAQDTINEGLTVYNTNPKFSTGRGIYTWQLSDSVYQWISLRTKISVVEKTLAVVVKHSVQTILPRTNSSTNPVTTDVVWDSIKGINTDDIKIINNTDIYLPPLKDFKITGYVGIYTNSVNNDGQPTYIASRFYLIKDGKPTVESLPISTWGYSESSTEAYHDGGVTNPICILHTGKEGSLIRMIANGPINDRTTRMAASTPLNAKYMSSIGSYLLIEEL